MQLDGAVGDDLVGVHVGLGAAAGLPHHQREVVVELAGDDLVGGAGRPSSGRRTSMGPTSMGAQANTDLTGRRRAGEGRGMRKVVIHRAGGYERLQIEEAAAPVPGAGELRVDVSAIGVNYADCVIRMGLYASAKEYVGWPITPGFEVAGVVSAIGAGVDGWALGQPVMAVTRFGGYAGQICVPAAQVFTPPAGLATAEAAGLPTIFLTADHALHTLARAGRGEWVLVHAAAGGVGSALVQLAARAGCRVVGVVGGAHKVAAARALGAELVIDRSQPGLWEQARRAAPAGFAAIFDANGVSTLRASYQHLAPAGRLVVYGFHSMLPRQGGPAELSQAGDRLCAHAVVLGDGSGESQQVGAGV
jgi:NADPH:quinone reductase-like Zn-dependent oxidoreductase